MSFKKIIDYATGNDFKKFDQTLTARLETKFEKAKAEIVTKVQKDFWKNAQT